MSPKVSSQGYGIDSNTLAMLQRDQGQVVRGKRRCAKIVISPIWQSGRGSRVLLGSTLTFVQLQEYVCHHKQSETDCIQLICVPTDMILNFFLSSVYIWNGVAYVCKKWNFLQENDMVVKIQCLFISSKYGELFIIKKCLSTSKQNSRLGTFSIDIESSFSLAGHNPS